MINEKLTDREIAKALSICSDENGICSECPYSDDYTNCNTRIAKDVIDLITRQQAKNEELVGNIDKLKAEIENLKVENQSIRSAANSLKMHYEEAQAEIERLNKVIRQNQQLINALNKSYFLAKAEAYKEFAKKLKEKYGIFTPLGVNWIEEVKAVRVSDIDKILKETVGEDNDRWR